MKNFKPEIKRFIQKQLPSSYPPLLVASMGRSGSTIIYKSIINALSYQRFGFNNEFLSRIAQDSAFSLKDKELYNGVVYKTHALGNEMPLKNVPKVVFVYGSASDAALSVLSCKDRYGEDWVNRHLDHIRASGTFSEIGSKDVLRFGDQLKSWGEQSLTSRLFLKYESLWDHQGELSEFCGYSVELPKKRSREGHLNIENSDVRRIQECYKDLDEEIDKLPGCLRLDVGEKF